MFIVTHYNMSPHTILEGSAAQLCLVPSHATHKLLEEPAGPKPKHNMPQGPPLKAGHPPPILQALLTFAISSGHCDSGHAYPSAYKSKDLEVLRKENERDGHGG